MTDAHSAIAHRGRDKTEHYVRERYSEFFFSKMALSGTIGGEALKFGYVVTLVVLSVLCKLQLFWLKLNIFFNPTLAKILGGRFPT